MQIGYKCWILLKPSKEIHGCTKFENKKSKYTKNIKT